MNTTQYLDAAKRRLKLSSDYKLATVLGLTRSALSAYRTKAVTLGDDTARAIAVLLALDPRQVLADMASERAAAPRAARRKARARAEARAT